MTTPESQDIYRTLLDNLSDGVMVIDADGTLRLANPALCRMFGFSSDDVVGRPFGEIFVTFEGFDDFVGIILEAITEQGDLKRRVVSVHSGDEVRSLSVTTSYLLTSGAEHTGQAAVIAVVADITEVRELREAELRMAKVVEEQLAELQVAYRDIETRNENLSLMMKRVQAARGMAALLVVGVFLIIGGWYLRPLDWFGDNAAPEPPAVAESIDPQSLPTLVVAPGEFRSTLSLRGLLEPGHIEKIVSPIDGHVSTVHISRGQRVQADAPLLVLDVGKLAMERRRAQVEYIRARNRLGELEAWDSSAEMTRSRRALRRATIALDEAQENLRETEFLLEQGIVAVSEQKRAQQNYQSRQLDHEEAERGLETAQEKGNDEAVEVARLELENAQGRLREHEAKMELATIKAPLAGIVIISDSDRNKPLEKGRPVTQGELLLSIADLDRFAALTSVDEVNVGKVEVGQRALITGPGFPGQELEGVVTQVSARAARGQRSAPQFEVTVAMENVPPTVREHLRVGMTAYITIVVHSDPEALLVPLTAVNHGANGANWLQVIDPDTGLAQRRPVELGRTTIDSVQVLQGLTAGEKIVLSQQ
ncbi:MAG: efflux RND transporter periplasmic adaptor subunit [Gammaproteobacteria bacterium]|nr:efflux RND transporter periplasmic adaptor subunit [Gammaproteobacteria bacterium]MCY4281659.1 efflux RND transporter periplasmic adaptor subunit [Gammaproteobacteria bacterium]